MSPKRILPLLFPFLGLAAATAQIDHDLPQVTGPWMNAGQPQRSMIQSIGVRFDRNVSHLVKPGALRVRSLATGAEVDLSAATLVYDPRNNSANWMIDRDTGALLEDGNYLAWIETATLLDEPRRAACAASAMPLDHFVFGFHQFTGDSDGDRDVDFRDAAVLRDTWLRNFGHQAYRSFLDFDLSDRVAEGDRQRVEETYFKLLPPSPGVHLFLRNDTGDSASDNATSLYAFGFGSVAMEDAAAWQARLGSGPAVDIGNLVSEGTGVLDEALIDQLNGGPLPTGNHRLTVEALDGAGAVLAADALDFEYLGEVPCGPYFITTPPPGVALGQVQAAEPLNLSTWTVERWPGSQGPSQWVVAPDGLSVEQTRNSAPAALISDQTFLNLRVTGRFRVDTAGDDDLMGFIFGYQNNKQFYIFDWKQGSQGFVGGTALRGMSIKRFDAGDREFTEPDFWWSDQDRENTTILVPPNDIPWKDFQDYDITLDFTPGRISVEVREEGVLLDRLEVEDDTFTGGRFGFYNYSQDSVIYSGFTQEALNNVYFYNSEAFDPDGGTVTYSLAPNEDGSEPPAGATVNAGTGLLIWAPETAGTFPFTLVATDNDGLTDTQRFDVEVSPVDEPPVVYINKTAPAVLPGEELAVQVVATDDQQIFRVRLFIDDLEAELDSRHSHVTSFATPGVVELRAIAIDSAQQVSSITSYVRVLDPDAPPAENPNQTPVSPPGQTTGDPTDLRPLVSFQAPLAAGDDPTRFVGTVDANGGTLDRWFLEWTTAAKIDPANLASPSVLWQPIVQGTDAVTAAELATIVPADFPDEPVAFRLRAQNTNGLGSIVSLVFNPRSTSTAGPEQETGTGTGVRALAVFTSPLGPEDDRTRLRGTVDANGGTLQSWVIDYAPRHQVDTSNLADPAVSWTPLAQGTAAVTDGLLATLDPTTLPDQTFVFRLTAVNTGGLGSVATLIYNPVAANFSGPGGTTGTPPANAQRPVTRILSPQTPGDGPTVLVGTISANGGTLQNWIVDFAPRAAVNPNDLSDPAVAWTRLVEGTDELTAADLAALDDPAFQTGLWIIRLRAFNTNGLGSLASIQLDPGDTSMPTVAITAPGGEATVGFLTEVRGTIGAGAGVLDSWRLEIAPTEEVSLTNLNASANWVLLGSGTTALDDQPLGTIDPTNLRNGSYVLRLRAFNTNGRGLSDGILVHVSGEAKLGNFRLEFEDLNLPLAGIPIRVTRVYDTLNANRSGDFGYGWTLGIGDPDIRETVPDTGDSWFFATPFEIGARVFLTTPEGKRVGFTFNVRNPRNRFLYVDYDPYFEPDPGVYETLTIAPSDYERVEVDASGAVYTPLLPFGYNPDNYRLTTKDGLVYNYNQRSGLQRITDRNGQTVSFSRNAITHSSGQSLAIARDSRGRVTTITAPGGEKLTYGYDSFGDLTTITDAAGGVTRLTYLRNPAHYLSTIATPTDAAAGRFTRRVIYENGRFVRVEDADGNPVSSQSYRSGEFTGTRTDALGNVTTLKYDARGNILEEVDPDGGVTAFEYGDPANPDKETALIDPNGNRTEVKYDARGNPIEILDAGGNRRSVAFNSGNQPTSLVLENAAGEVLYSISAEYDANGNLVRFVDCSGQERNVTYDAQGRPVEIVGFDGATTFLSYDSPGSSHPATVMNAAGDTKEFEFDSAGRLLLARASDGGTLSFRYDAKGRLVERTGDDGLSSTISYDGNGNPVRVTDRDGNITELEYDSADRVTREIKLVTDDGDYSDDIVTEVTYDAAGQVTSVTDPLGRTTRYEYTPGRRLRARIDHAGRETRFEYDGNGNVTEIVDREGRRRTFDYDYRNLMVREEWYAAGGDVVLETFTWEYNEFGRPVRLADSRTVLNYEYDCGGLSRYHNTGSTGVPTFDFSLTHDANRRLTSVVDHHGARVDRDHDAEGNLASLAWSGCGLPGSGVAYQRDPYGFVSELARFSDAARTIPAGRTLYDRDPFEGTVRRIRHLRPDGGLVAPGADFEFERDRDDKILGQSLQGDVAQFQYDDLGQLTSATHSAPELPDEFYEYDAVGNRTNSHLGGASVVDGLGRLTANDDRTYEYDEENNRIREVDAVTGESRSYGYDHRNRLVWIVVADSGGGTLSTTTFLYDPLDRLIGRTIDGSSTFTTYLDDNPWADTTADGTVLARYLYDGTIDGLVARWAPGDGVEWMLVDQLRSVRYATDDQANVTATIGYDSFGNPLIGEADLARLRHGFTGREYLGSGLHHFRQRVYDSFTGRFLSDDPLAFAARDFNFQRYAFNDPLGLIDPTGMLSVSVTEVSFAGSLQFTLASGRVVASISFRAVALNAAAGAVFGPLLDIMCLAITGDLERLDFARTLRQAAIGAVTGGLGGAAGSALGNLAIPGLAGAVNMLERASPTTLKLLGNWLMNIESAAIGATIGRGGVRAAFTSPLIVESGLRGSGCDSFFYTLIGGR